VMKILDWGLYLIAGSVRTNGFWGTARLFVQYAEVRRQNQRVAACQKAGMTHDSHLKGGIQAWKAAGFPTIAADPATGNPHDRG